MASWEDVSRIALGLNTTTGETVDTLESFTVIRDGGVYRAADIN